MPRPTGVALHELFGPADPPHGWEDRVDYRMYFVHGIAEALALVGKRPTSKEFMPLRSNVAAARAEAGWERGLAAKTWSAFSSDNQVKRFVSVRNNTFTTAANGILAIELLLKQNDYKGDIYKDRVCYVVPQDSHISGLTHPEFKTVCLSAAERGRKSWQDMLCPESGQPPELFADLVAGQLVTKRLAEELLQIFKKYHPNFDGRVSSEFSARQETLGTLRRDGLRASGKKGQNQYKKRITGALHEYYAR